MSILKLRFHWYTLHNASMFHVYLCICICHQLTSWPKWNPDQKQIWTSTIQRIPRILMIHNIFTLDIHVFIMRHHDLHEISSRLTMKKNDTVNMIISMRIFQLNSPPNKTLRLPLRPLAGICSSSWRRRSSRADGLATGFALNQALGRSFRMGWFPTKLGENKDS